MIGRRVEMERHMQAKRARARADRIGEKHTFFGFGGCIRRLRAVHCSTLLAGDARSLPVDRLRQVR